ncbi:MAG TPA: hypothetical protein VGN82_17075 [Bosea sp. (in: a-proteobacteria)]|jgi:hypothetical protein|uniref:hypothetical protein n=1 Tax=Bosea sp. (in: a-proteobacteria) TaxID=1871050 RepID=UPI002E14F65C|nr:hypothetical protein [Bosea sp. (in: a-proteobacteria)]
MFLSVPDEREQRQENFSTRSPSDEIVSNFSKLQQNENSAISCDGIADREL